LVAVNVAVSPADPPGTVNVGVVSAVTLSVSDDPESEDARRSGSVGALGAVDAGAAAELPLGAGASMTILSELLAADSLPAVSVSFAVTFQVPPDNVGRSQEVAVPIV